MISVRQQRARPAIAAVVRGFRERQGDSPGPGVIVPLPGRPAQFLEIYLYDPYRVSTDGGAFERAPEAVAVGPSSRHSTRLLVQGRISAFHIAFQPTGFHRLFGIPMHLLADGGVPVADLGVRALTDLVDLVRQQGDFASRVATAEDWLAHRLASARASGPLDDLARLIRRARTAPPVADMARRAGLSPRQHQRAFVDQVGLPPKIYVRTVRFEAVLDARQHRPDASWADLAQQFGYFDQSHLLRDARAFTGGPLGALSDPS